MSSAHKQAIAHEIGEIEQFIGRPLGGVTIPRTPAPSVTLNVLGSRPPRGPQVTSPDPKKCACGGTGTYGRNTAPGTILTTVCEFHGFWGAKSPQEDFLLSMMLAGAQADDQEAKLRCLGRLIEIGPQYVECVGCNHTLKWHEMRNHETRKGGAVTCTCCRGHITAHYVRLVEGVADAFAPR